MKLLGCLQGTLLLCPDFALESFSGSEGIPVRKCGPVALSTAVSIAGYMLGLWTSTL